ncbi:MAG TPA: hypothetical protein GYA06_12155 [Chloroflexi bacterium]|nr:hypothetical protein [Chloroflexota bacterium]HPO57903.1 histidine kinase dimerization/phospho-acceptor domain-containing protein [Anaerolineaceae bacterium]
MRRHGEELSEEGQDYARRMVDSARRLQEMINDLLDYSRVNTRGHVFEEVPLDQVVDGVITDLELRLRESGGTIERGPLPTIQADPLQMRQLFTNLLSNALKFRRPDAAPTPPRGCRCGPRRRPRTTPNGWPSPWKTTASASTKNTWTACSSPSSGCTAARSTTAAASGWPSAAASSSATAARSRPVRGQGRAAYSP